THPHRSNQSWFICRFVSDDSARYTRIVVQDVPYDPWALAEFFSKDQLERGPEGFARGYLPLHWGAGPVFAPAKPAFPPSMAVGEAPHKLPCNGSQSARQG